MRDSFDRLWMTLLAVAICMAAMAVLVAGIALALGTTAHDWYATGKVTLADALIALGFDEFAPTEYRTTDGQTLRLSRFRLTIGEAWAVRARMVSMAADRAVLGGCAGLSVAVLWLRVHKAVRPSWPDHSDVVAQSEEVWAAYRSAGSASAGGRIADRLRPGCRRARIGLLVVAPDAELESLLERARGIDLVGDAPEAGHGPEGSRTRPEAVPAPRVQTLPMADVAEQPGSTADGSNPGAEPGAGRSRDFF